MGRFGSTGRGGAMCRRCPAGRSTALAGRPDAKARVAKRTSRRLGLPQCFSDGDIESMSVEVELPESGDPLGRRKDARHDHPVEGLSGHAERDACVGDGHEFGGLHVESVELQT